MGDDFGIGVGLELDAFADELGLQGGVVFDNAVVDDGEFPVKAHVGVGVGFGGGAVGCPAGMRDAYMSLDGRARQFVFKRLDFARSTNNVYLAVVNQGNARTVVTAVFQLFQAIDKDGKGFVLTDVGNYSAHKKVLFTNYTQNIRKLYVKKGFV